MNLHRAALWLSIFTVIYNLLEGLVSFAFSALDNSAALLGFGADSIIESLSGAVMVWRFWNPAGAEQREQRAAQLVGVTFFILATFVCYESLEAFWTAAEPEPSLAALIIAVISLVVMPALFLLKRRTAKSLGSGSLLADSKQTLACMLLSVALLVGAGLNYWFGWWQADPTAGLFISLYLIREGYEAIKTRHAGCC